MSGVGFPMRRIVAPGTIRANTRILARIVRSIVQNHAVILRKRIYKIQIFLELPFPPTVNTYWRRVGGKTLISQKGRVYAAQVAWMTRRAARFPAGKRAAVVVEAYMPDKRNRDLDNLFKALLDSLVKAGVLVDDSVIDDLRIVRKGVVSDGKVLVSIEEVAC